MIYLDVLSDVVQHNQTVHDGGGHHQLLDSVCHGLQQEGLAPGQALLLVLLDLVPHHLQV